MKNIAFFLSAQNIDKKYSEPALLLIELCVQNGYGFLYGGSEYGFMKMSASHVRKLKGRIIAVSSEEFKAVLSKQVDESFIASNVQERKRMFLEKADAVIALPGGTGTLDEITDVIALKKLDRHQKPIVLFNTDGFWNGLIEQYSLMHKEGFLPKPPGDLFFVNDNPDKTIRYLKTSLH